MNISGGTVQCGSIHSSYDLSCTITGGSLYCDKKNVDCTPVNGSKEEVLQTEVILFQLGDRVPVTAAEITTGTGAYDYGLHDVVTINGGKVYPWLPYGTAVEKATASGTDYYGKAFSSHSGTLYPPTEIVLDSLAPGKPGAQNGSARGPYGWSKATDLVNAVRPGYILKGYAADRNSNQLVMDADGTFYENIAGYTGQGGEWKLMGGSITLYALWESDPFTVHFESNVPAGASTVPSGEMADEDFIYPDPKALTDRLHEQDVHLMLSVWSKVDKGCAVGRELERRGAYIPGTDWIDFFQPEAADFYWQSFRDSLTRYGIDAWWFDATEPENDDLHGRRVAGGRMPSDFYRNVYPLMVNRTMYRG